MPPTVILIRHGEALHNAQLREHLPIADEVEVIISSPMIRTVETTLIGLDWLIERGVPVKIDALWQGSEVSRLIKLFPTIDFSTVDPAYPSKAADTPYVFTRSGVVDRGQACLRDLYQRKEKVVAVVTHSAFLRCAVCHCMFFNADYRIFDFVEGTSPSSPEIIEWPLTAENGGGMGKSAKGRAEIQARDFPAEQQLEQVKRELGGAKNSGEATKEVP
ncbi:hypothetical protein MBLNU459_g5144t1 [Dothideomycetes sp. NU459]